jgi:hypothetical protein
MRQTVFLSKFKIYKSMTDKVWMLRVQKYIEEYALLMRRKLWQFVKMSFPSSDLLDGQTCSNGCSKLSIAEIIFRSYLLLTASNSENESEKLQLTAEIQRFDFQNGCKLQQTSLFGPKQQRQIVKPKINRGNICWTQLPLQ